MTSTPDPLREALAYAAAEVTPERLALWHDYPVTEAGESILVNAEWHDPQCASNRTNLYRDCRCSLNGAVVSIEVEAVIAARRAALSAQPAPPPPLDVERLARTIRDVEAGIVVEITTGNTDARPSTGYIPAPGERWMVCDWPERLAAAILAALRSPDPGAAR
jgi:hypothetical protein